MSTNSTKWVAVHSVDEVRQMRQHAHPTQDVLEDATRYGYEHLLGVSVEWSTDGEMTDIHVYQPWTAVDIETAPALPVHRLEEY